MDRGQTAHRVSAVVIARNEERTIAGCIESVWHAFSRVVGSGEILVVDSSSADRTADLAVRSGARVFVLRRASRIGPSAARRIGAVMTQSQYILFMDGDCELEPAFLPEALRAMETDPALGVTAGSRLDFYRTPQGLVAAEGEYYRRQRATRKRRYGGCALYRREALEAAGSFNPFLKAREEEDLRQRIEAAGFGVSVLDIPMVRHMTVPRESARRLIRSLRHGFLVGWGQAVRIFLRRGRVRSAFDGLSRVLLTYAGLLAGVACLLLWYLDSVRLPLILWGCSSAALLAVFSARSRSLKRAVFYVIEWIVQGVCLFIGFLTPVRAPEDFRWEGEERTPGGKERESPVPRVLLVAPYPDPPFQGGVERGVDLLLRGRLARRASMRLFNTYRSPDPGRSAFERIAYMIRMIRALRREIAASEFDLVHIKTSSGINFYQNSLYALAARRKGLPVVLQLHCGKLPAFYLSSPWFLRSWIRRTLTSVNRVAVLSEAWSERVAAIAPRSRRRIVPNGLEEADLDSLHPVKDRSRSSVLFLGTGRADLNREKGLEDLLEIMPSLVHRYPKAAWVLAGLPDPESVRERLERRLTATEVSVCCRGLVEGDAKIALFRSSSILVLPSYFENMPNTVLEAMAAGMAVVATNLGAIPEMLGNGAGGILTEPGDRESLGRGLERLLEAPEMVERLGLRNRSAVAQEYTMEVVERKLEDLYREAADWTSLVRWEGSGAARSAPEVDNPAAISVAPLPMAKP
jgi:glycosyltransferase involved in cell wall biosynthesis